MRQAFPAAFALLTALAPAFVPAQDAKPLPKLKTEIAFPNLKFVRPVALAYPDDGSDRLYVVEQHEAKIWSFSNDKESSDKRLFLQLPDPISKDNEEGLLGLAFHPKFKENGEFFVYYSGKEGPTNRRSVVSRFKVSKDDKTKADPKTEERIWVGAPDPFGNHNGGCIEFGPDGYLYIALGDSGAGGDPLSTGQNPADWWASILRIDVDHPTDGKAYGIPKDNPMSKGGDYAKWAPEVYAIGLRNVWKFTFDHKTGTLWAGDVGQNLYEMVHIIRNGGNYGWSTKEAFHPFEPNRKNKRKPDPAAPITPPLVEYPHIKTAERPDDGKSVTGGYVYRGKALPELDGVYVYGDYDTGRIWGLREQDGKAVVSAQLIDVDPKVKPKLSIAAFGEDAEGELYILVFDGKNGAEGRIHRLARK